MTQPTDKKKVLLKGFLISFTGAILFSTKAIIIKKAFHSTSADALTLLMLRMLFSLPFYLVAAFWGRSREGYVKMNRRQWIWIVVLGLLGYYLSSFFDFVGLQYVSAGLERLILFIYPSLAVLINAWVFKHRINRAQSWALLLTYAGIGIAYFGELKIDTGNPHFYWGSFLIFLCAITYAFYLAGTGRMIPILGAARFTTWSMLVATGAVLLHFMVRSAVRGDYHLTIFSNGLWMYGVLLALLATVIPSFMLSAGMKRIGPNNAAIVTSVGPVSTILQAHFILGDKIFMEQVVGTVLVIIGILLIGWQSRQPIE
ncbi:MAG TPA: DMT family transporter [Chitinophagaceae bacterium]|jgi:drug/metabolite transporter (DMT)-like permease